jgi:hypothetical protein
MVKALIITQQNMLLSSDVGKMPLEGLEVI